METLYLDTSIFESNNFFEGHRIRELFKLAREKKINVVIPELTYDEINNRLRIRITESHNKFRNDHRVLRNIPSIEERFQDFDLESILQEAEKRLKEVFEEANFNVVQYPALNIGSVFKKYFATEYPFNLGKKKNEFPDAFALNSVENWAATNKVKVTLFSKDRDLLNYKSEHLIIQEDFDGYIDAKIREAEENKAAIKKVDDFIAKEPYDILSRTKEWFEDQLYIWDKYYEVVNFLEVHDIEVDTIEPEIDEYEIMEFDEEYIAVQFKILVNFSVKLTIDDEDYMVKDDDTKEWIYLDTTTKTYEDSKYIDLDVTFYPTKSGSTDLFIEQINHGKELSL